MTVGPAGMMFPLLFPTMVGVHANEWVPRFHAELAHLENLDIQWHCEPSDSGVQHLFTDGSCQLPGHPIGQLSSWAFELANVTKVVASGLLPGRWQGIARAELFAVLQSLLWAAHYLVPVHLYCDSAFVVRRLRLLLGGSAALYGLGARGSLGEGCAMSVSSALD